jgi:hypothetical protein
MKRKTMPNFIDINGRRFGRWQVLARNVERPNLRGGSAVWRCQCDCGTIRAVPGYHLRNGRSTSCGCLNREQTRERMTTHGHTRNGVASRTHRSWKGMIVRCTKPNVTGFYAYGGRGITVCHRWRYGEDGKSGFECFLADMGERPPGLILNRRDHDGNYNYSNCCWAKRRKNRRIVHEKLGRIAIHETQA